MFNFCITREEGKPTTCCCGCTVYCAVITVTVLNLIGLVSAVAGLRIPQIILQVAICAPFLSLFIWPNSRLVRQICYVLNCVEIVFLVFMLIVFVATIDSVGLPT